MLKPEFVRRVARMHRPAGRCDRRAGAGDADRHRSSAKAASTYNAMILADGGRVLGAHVQARAAQLRHVRREAHLHAGAAARADRVQGREDSACRSARTSGRSRSAPISPSRRRDAAGAQRQPVRARQGRHALAAGSRRGRSRPAFRSPTSTASAARTSWPSTARRSSCIPTASASCRCPTGTKRCCSPNGRADPDGWRCDNAREHELDAVPGRCLPGDDGRLRDYVDRNGFPGVILGLSGGIDSALSAAVAVDALGAGQGARRDAPVEIYQRGEPRGRARMRPAARLPP